MQLVKAHVPAECAGGVAGCTNRLGCDGIRNPLAAVAELGTGPDGVVVCADVATRGRRVVKTDESAVVLNRR